MIVRVGVLTISDAGARGERIDRSGDAIVAWCARRGDDVSVRALVADDTGAIVRHLMKWCDEDAADLVLTTGGTGLSERDITPEATACILDRDAPGIAERIRITCMESFPRAALSRGRAGVRARSLIVNLPGSTGGVRDALQALDPIITHAVDILRGNVTDHSGGAAPK